MQVTLFEVPKIDESKIDDLIKIPDGSGILGAYNLMRQNEIGVAVSLNRIVQKRLLTDWGKIWDRFEREGMMYYMDEIELLGVKVSVCEPYEGGDIYFNVNDTSISVLSWDEDDVFDDKMTAKIRRKVKECIYSNEGQFRYLFEELPFNNGQT